ncbi:MAG: zinc-ribbon domain-containing protein, partial [Dehalococcoidia bacterium]|nr:zinc-ribbon domain-containing protein [Dehalococcoidia bacterium]
MECHSCGAVNPEDATFCGECGLALVQAVTCPSCARENPLSTKFCHGCGTPLAVSTAQTNPAPTVKPARIHPASFVKGRYVVIHFLGEGGKKIVYLCHDTLLNRDVAFALIKLEGLD